MVKSMLKNQIIALYKASIICFYKNNISKKKHIRAKICDLIFLNAYHYFLERVCQEVNIFLSINSTTLKNRQILQPRVSIKWNCHQTAKANNSSQYNKNHLKFDFHLVFYSIYKFFFLSHMTIIQNYFFIFFYFRFFFWDIDQKIFFYQIKSFIFFSLVLQIVGVFLINRTTYFVLISCQSFGDFLSML